MNRRILTSSNFYFAVIIDLLATAMNLLSGQVIKLLYPNRTTINDLFFDHLPLIHWTQYLTDIFVLVAAVIILIYVIKYEIKYLPYVLIAFGVFYMFRSGMVLLNPFGGYFGNEMTYGISTIKQYGAFPSGHTGFMVVAYMLADDKKSRPTRIVLLLLVLGEIISLLLSRGHYSIDIVGGLLLGYFIGKESKRYKEELVL